MRDYELRWKGYDVEHLILATEEFIVFLNRDLFTDWATTPAYDKKGHKDASQHRAIMNEAAPA